MRSVEAPMLAADVQTLLVPVYLMLTLLLTGFTWVMWRTDRTAIGQASFSIFAGSSAVLVIVGIAGESHPLLIAIAPASGVLILAPIIALLDRVTETKTSYTTWAALFVLGQVSAVLLWSAGAPFVAYAYAAMLGFSGMGFYRTAQLAKHLKAMSAPAKLLWLTAAVMGLHTLDFPILRLRTEPWVMVAGFTMAMVTTLMAGLSAPAITAAANARRAAKEKAYAAAISAQRAAIADYLAKLTHEFRNPLTAVLGYSDLIRESIDDGASPAEVVSDIDRIRRSGSHLLSLIDDVLDLAKVQAGRLELEIAPTEVADILKDVQAATEPLVRANQNDLVVPDGASATGWVDGRRLRQCLINLVANAAKFTRDGHVKIQFLPRADGVWEFMVTDTGVGMDEATLEKVFEPFVQAHVGVQHSHGGTGLGLPLTRELAQRMGGDLVATSRPGRGTRFVLTVQAGDANTDPNSMAFTGPASVRRAA